MQILDFPLTTFASRLYTRAFEEDVFSTAAQVAFYFSFAIFPLLLFLVSLFGLVLNSDSDLRSGLYQSLNQIMPGSAFTLIRTTIEEVTANSSSGKLTLGLFVALWSASAGLDSIRIALNSVYRIRESRAWWKTKLISLLFTVIITVMIATALAIVFYGWRFIVFVLNAFSLEVTSLLILHLIEWTAIILLLLIVFDLLYNFIPDHSPFRRRWITPGAVAGIVLWLILSGGFRLYLDFYNSYSRMYGSLGAMIIMMLWLYLTSLVILAGGLINSIILEIRNESDRRDGLTESALAAGHPGESSNGRPEIG